MFEKDQPLYMISVVAKLLNVHPQTLRQYEKKGLIKPSRTEGNVRLYSLKDIEELKEVLDLTQKMKVNIAGVEVILTMKNKLKELEGKFNQVLEFLKKKLDEENLSSEAKDLVNDILDILGRV